MRRNNATFPVAKPMLSTCIALAFACSANTWAAPSWMAVGTYTINNYTGNGGGGSDLTYCHADGDNFYRSAVAHSRRGTPREVNLKDAQVTLAAFQNTQSREKADFVFFSGHGYNAGMFLGNGAGYGTVGRNSIQLGTGYNRWLCAHACKLFYNANNQEYWNPIFRGLRAMIGFRSDSWDHSLSANEWESFWSGWVDSNRSMWVAYRDASADWQYRNIGSSGIEPGCLSAAGTDYCNQTYLQANTGRGNVGAGVFFSTVFGTPSYL